MRRAGLRSVWALGKQQEWGLPSQPKAHLKIDRIIGRHFAYTRTFTAPKKSLYVVNFESFGPPQNWGPWAGTVAHPVPTVVTALTKVQLCMLRGPGPEGAPSYYNLLCKVIFWCLKSVCKSNRGPKHIWNLLAWATLVTPVKLVIQHWNHLSIKTNSTGPIGSFNCEVPLYTHMGPLEFLFF